MPIAIAKPSLPNNFKNFPRTKIFLTGKIEKFLLSQDVESVKKIYLQKLYTLETTFQDVILVLTQMLF